MHICWIILAAGRGTRLVSSFPNHHNVPKPFLPFLGKPMVSHILDRIPPGDTIILVTSPQQQTQIPMTPNLHIVQQSTPQGTGDAVRKALQLPLPIHPTTFCVLNADGPKVPVGRIRDWAVGGGPCVVVTRRRLLPFADAMGKYCPETRRIHERPADRSPSDLVNTGVYIFENTKHLHHAMNNLPWHPEKQEFYLTDVLEHLPEICIRIVTDPQEALLFQGINTLEEWRFVETLPR